MVAVHGNCRRGFSSFGFAVEAGAPGDFDQILIVGGAMSEVLPASPGNIRAYDAHSGQLRWSFHTIPHPGEYGYDTWKKDAWLYVGGANTWGEITVDEKMISASTDDCVPSSRKYR